ncbi:hypothetical protein LSH36_486g03016 [Paralvinella palmiformis]|uniref:Pre-mRNA-splicing factor SPF27 n=1 Tax=Paralvinella palmiformis TaxID=53620 RepID=A0AAD9MYB9_9ANNE|nr:hypothetical protein LSH36_486g03016 [Paralvinella palmiformis]
MAGEVLVDALPYYDQGYDESGVREAALALVEEETRRYRPTKNYLEHLPAAAYNAFETETMKTEFERLQARLPMDMLSMKRYELPQPTAGRMNDVAAWMECVENSQAQLEHQALRIANLELMSQYGADSWKMYNDVLQKMVSSSQKQLVEIRKQIQDINWRRKGEQSEAGSKLKQLEESWVGLVSKNYEIERACVDLENEIEMLQQKKKQRAKQR